MTLLIVRPTNRQETDLDYCRRTGIPALPFAPLQIEPIAKQGQQLPRQLSDASAVFWVSPTAVECAMPYICPHDYPHLIHIAVGKGTAAALLQAGITRITSPDSGNDSEAVLRLAVWESMPQAAKIVIIRGENGRNWLAEQLNRRGFQTVFAEIYRRIPHHPDWTLFQAAHPKYAWITSTELAEQLFQQSPPAFTQTLQSLLYFTHHPRIRETLYRLGAKQVELCSGIESLAAFLKAHP